MGSLLALGLILSPFDASRKGIASTFLPDDAEIACRAILPRVSSDRTGLFCVPVIPVLPSPIPMPVEPPDLNQPNLLKVGDAELPAPGRSDSWMSPQRLPELKFLFGPPACIPLEWVWTPAAAVRGCDRELG